MIYLKSCAGELHVYMRNVYNYMSYNVAICVDVRGRNTRVPGKTPRRDNYKELHVYTLNLNSYTKDWNKNGNRKQAFKHFLSKQTHPVCIPE